ncbi:MAG: response regulator [Sulfurospirillum sp.]|nr:response regulator [Sulfurospirillum sp.]MBL0703676.1 response regulator [Sulfurospirillum sp.]
MKLLVVDDRSIIRSIIKKTLAMSDYQNVLEAKNGAVALQIMSENDDIDVLLTDWNMPEVNGLELVKKIRAESKYKNIPIIMITGEGGKAEVIEALKAGVNNYILKPFTPAVLKEKLDNVLLKR